MLEQYLRDKLPDTCVGEFINREESWLEFNLRILDCAQSNRFPLNERWNFLAITTSNLDEFIGVRLGEVINISMSNYDILINKINKFINLQHEVYLKLLRITKKTGATISEMSELKKSELSMVKEIFINQIFTVVTPIAINSVNDSPNILSGTTCIATTIHDDIGDVLSIIQLHSSLPKIIKVSDEKYVLLENIVKYFLSEIYVNKKIKDVSIFKVIKNMGVELSHDESKFIIERMNDTLMKRQFSEPIFLITDGGTSKNMRKLLSSIFTVPKDRIIGSDIVDYKRFNQPLLSSEYSFKKFTPPPFTITNEQYSMFSLIDDNDILLHHPYDNYDTVIKLIQHASTDPKVLSIKITLYRVSGINSPIIEALIEAANRGKQVIALVEIKARFDEDNNLKLVSKLKYGGVNVILGMESLKAHCKMCIISRKTKHGVRVYSHIATGNYNENTSKNYTDLSFLTAKQKIGMDLINVFNLMAGISSPVEKLQKVFYAPINLRKQIEKMIDREIEFVKTKDFGKIIFKINSLSDDRIVNKLYEAADAGVDIEIICRGVCSIVSRPNIKIKSIVGRFLEHSRIYYFNNGGDSEFYMASADLLTRNLDRRIELMLEISDEECKKTIANILQTMRNDELNSYEMTTDARYTKTEGNFNSHKCFMYQRDSEIKLNISI